MSCVTNGENTVLDFAGGGAMIGLGALVASCWGSNTVKRVVLPRMLSTSIFPLSRWTSPWQVANPIPFCTCPWRGCCSRFSIISYLLNTLWRSAGFIPSPEFSTLNSSCDSLTSSFTFTNPFTGVYLNALDTRLVIIVVRAERSVFQSCSPWVSTLKWMFFCSASRWNVISMTSTVPMCMMRCSVSTRRNSMSSWMSSLRRIELRWISDTYFFTMLSVRS